MRGEYIGDFGLLTSLSWADYDLALKEKVYHPCNTNRNTFRVKVGAFFGRPTDVDSDRGLANPYAPVAAIKRHFFARVRAYICRGL